MSAFGWQDRPVRLTISARTDPGMRRRENQDGFLVAELHADAGAALLDSARAAEGAAETVLGSRGLLAVVADGMGGASGGSLASRLALETIHRTLRERWSPDRNLSPQQFSLRLREAVECANTAVHRESQRDSRHHGMGTTATAAGFLDGFVYLAQVGDSRAYLVRRGRAAQLTRDQSLVQELMDAGTLTPEDAEKSEHGSVLLQAVGPDPSIRVEVTYQEIRRGDVVVLCSDGLFRVVRLDEIAEATGRIADNAALCDLLVRTANERGGPDNVTVVVVRADGPGLEDPREGDAMGRQVLALSAT